MVKQERAARTRQALIRAGAEVVAKEGFAPASLSTISRRAGVSNGALHFHFESKKVLAQAIESEALETVRRIVGDAAEKDGGPLQGLVDAMHELVGSIADDAVIRAGFELGDDPAYDAEPSLRREWQQWVEEMLHRAEREGWLAEGVAADDAATAIVAATVGFEVLGAGDRTWLREEKLAGFWDLLLPRLTERYDLVSVSVSEVRNGIGGKLKRP